MNSPLVSVALPCYNQADALPIALASLVSQTVEEWECILVDDGSTDGSAAIAVAMGDPRLRVLQLSPNRGRGAARQAALEAARGQFFCKLDADDWFYPDKLAHQLQVMECLPDIGAVGTRVAIIDRQQVLVGVRGPLFGSAEARVFEPVRTARLPNIARASFMLRTRIAQQCAYDPSLRRGEDTDFLYQALAMTHYAALPAITYVYREESIHHLSDILGGYIYRLRVLWKYRKRSRSQIAHQIVLTVMKAGLLGVAALLGLDRAVIRRRSKPATVAEKAAYLEAQAAVLATCRRLFGEVGTGTRMLSSKEERQLEHSSQGMAVRL